MANQQTGTIVSVEGQIAEVRFLEERPGRHDILTVEDRPGILLEVTNSASENSFYCFVLNPDHKLARGMAVVNTQESLKVPVGEDVLGRAFDIFADPHDEKGAVESKVWKPMFGHQRHNLADVKNPEEIIETGIKAIDFFTPILRGGKTALVGGAGVGKTVVLTAIMNRLVVQGREKESKAAVFAAVGERSREAQELYQQLEEAGALPYTSLVLGQMGENPALRFRTAFAAATVAEYFREQKTNMLYFMDNMYRFTQAGHELSTLMGEIPSEDGYQPTLQTEIASLTERLISTVDASITSFLTVFVPSDDLTDHSVRSTFPYLDSMIILSRDVFQSGRLPAMDLLRSISSALNPITIGDKHYETYIRSKQMLEQAHDLQRIVSLVGEAELSEENQQIYRRSRLIENYMSQDLFLGSSISDNTQEFISRQETVDTMYDIINGKYDRLDPNDLLYIGSITSLQKEEKPPQEPQKAPAAP